VNSRVGIGKTEPTVALDVVGAVTASGNMTVTGASKVGIGTDTLDAILNVGSGALASGDQILKLNTDSPWAFEHETDGLGLRASTANKKLYIQSSDFSNVATFDVTGNKVGIGLTDPASKLHVMGDIIGRNVSNTHSITGTDGGSDTFTLLPDQNRIVVTHVGSAAADGAYEVNMTGGIPTTIGSILYLEIVSSKTNTDASSHTHSTTLKIAALNYLTTGSITVSAANNAGDVYERTLRRTIILTSDGWKDYSVYPKVSVPTTDDAIIFSTTENTTQDTAGSDKPLTERLRITGNGRVGIGTATPGAKMDIYTGATGTVGLSFDRFASGNYRTDIYQNTYGLDFRVGYAENTPESVLYLKRFSNGSKEVEINGNVGIGTDNPGLPLELYTGNGANYHLRLKRYPTGAAYSDIGHLSTPGTEGLAFKVSDGNVTTTEVMRVCGTGNVGIGTNNPGSKLDIRAGSSFVYIQGPNQGNSGGLNNDPWRGLMFTRIGTSGETYNGNVSLYTYRWKSSGQDPAMALRFNLSDTAPYNTNDVMTIRSDNRVGIGSTTPANTLDVNGGISTAAITSTGGFVTTTGIQISMASGDWKNVIDFRSYRYAWKRMFIAGYRYGYNLTGNATFFVTTDTGNWYATLTQEYNYAGVEFRVSGSYIQAKQAYYLGNTESLIFRIVSLT
jgi:hypothetical protein